MGIGEGGFVERVTYFNTIVYIMVKIKYKTFHLKTFLDVRHGVEHVTLLCT